LEKKDDDKQQENDREKLLLQEQITEMRTKIDLATRQIKGMSVASVLRSSIHVQKFKTSAMSRTISPVRASSSESN
jgi:TATA-binding protein-associated factor Taf7